MQDFIPIGTGNSRYLKSVENFKTLYPTYDAFAAALVAGTLPVDFNGINEAGIVQKGMALNKYNLLKDATAALFCLDATAVPDDVLAFLGQYNQHWWSVLHGQASTKYEETKEVTTYPVYIYKTRHTLTYSDSITVDESTGAVSMVNPQETEEFDHTEAKSNLQKLALSLAGKYVTNMETNTSDTEYGSDSYASSDIFYVPSDITYDDMAFETGEHDISRSIMRFNTGVLSKVNARIVNISAGETTYVQSSDRNAYPDNGAVGDLTYTYIGIPFDNAVTAPAIETGSYVGTGTYGSDNPNKLSFAFEPQMVVISGGSVTREQRGTSFPLISGSEMGISSRGSSVGKINLSWEGASLSWYDPLNNQYQQLNGSGIKYYYIAIG